MTLQHQGPDTNLGVMDVNHIQSLRTAFTPAHIQLACDGVYLALPRTRTSVWVWSLQDITCKPLELEGHRKILTSLTLGHVAMPKLLLSAAEDYVIIWNIHQARQKLDKGEKIRGTVIGTTLGSIYYSCFSPDDSLVAVCSGFEVFILQTKRECVVATLEGHDGQVTAAEFCPHYTSTLVTVSDDRTFKVWNLDDQTLIYQSPILTASPFLSVAMSLQQPHVAIGAADGMVRVFDLTDGNGFRCLHQMDCSKIISKQKELKQTIPTNVPKDGPVKISSRATWKQADKNMSATELVEPTEDSIEMGHTVLSLHFTYVPREGSTRQTWSAKSRPAFLQNKSGIVKDLLNESPMLLVGTPAGLLQVNVKTIDTCSYVDFQDPISSSADVQTKSTVLNAAGSVNFSQATDPSQIWCLIGSPFQNVVHVLSWKHATSSITPRQSNTQAVSPTVDLKEFSALSVNNDGQGSEQREGLTVLSNEPMLAESPLRADMVPKTKESPMKSQKGFVSSAQKGKVMDNQPLTFKTKIKSSGYTAAPRTTMFKPKTNFSKTRTPPRRGSTSSSSSSSMLGLDKEYPMLSPAPTCPSTKLDVAERPCAINHLAISDDGQTLACALANKSAQVFTVPLSGKGTSYTGHNHIVTSVDWSHDSNFLLTSSDDKTAMMWVKGQSDPVLTFDRVKKTVTVEKEGQKKDKENKPFLREVKFGQFYYMDKFVLLTSGNNMNLYKYHIDSSKNDVKRYLSNSRYKLVQSWAVEAQQVSALSAINAFYSYIVLVAGSNKSLEVYDMNVGSRVRRINDVHSRPVHVIRQNEGSSYVSHPANAYDLYLTAAAGDCIKLWDLRTNRCVRRYEGHMNRVHPCGLALSPCGRFIATGSEDKCTYIFDIRTGTYSHKLQGHTDVVSDVVYHPLHPQLYTGTLDGKLQLYFNR